MTSNASRVTDVEIFSQITVCRMKTSNKARLIHVSNFGDFMRVPLAVPAAFMLVVPLNEAAAAQITQQASFPLTITASLTGNATTATLSVPKFNPLSGQLNSVNFTFSGSFNLTAACTTQGGVFIPPDSYIKSYTWACYYYARLYGTGDGFNVLKSSYQSDYQHDSQGDPFVVNVSITKSGTFSGDLQIPYSTATTSAFPQFIGTGTAPVKFDSALSTAIPPLSATVAGFTWQFGTITSAGIWGNSSQTISIVYDYTPYPTLQQPLSNSVQTDPLTIQFTLPEAAAADTLKVIFTNASGTDYTLNLPASWDDAGSHALTINPSTAGLPDGVYSVKVAYRTNAANPDSVSAIATNIQIDTQPLTAWKKAALGDAGASDLGDPDGDNIPNIMEYAFNFNPLTPNANPLTTGTEVDTVDGMRYFVIGYPRRISGSAVTYTLEKSTDLINWDPVQPSEVQQAGDPVPTGDGVTEKANFRALPAIDAGSSLPTFFRLKIDP